MSEHEGKKPGSAPNGSTQDSVQRAWHIDDDNIAFATEWLIKQRWRFLVNRLRVAGSTTVSTQTTGNEFSLLAEMNRGEQPRSYSGHDPFIETQPASVRGLDGERFIGELSIVFFINAIRAGSLPSAKTLRRRWRSAIAETLLVYTEACVLETLNDSRLPGELAVASLAESVKIVRDFRSASEYTQFLPDDLCAHLFRRCFDQAEINAEHPTIANRVNNEHFPFLDQVGHSKHPIGEHGTSSVEVRSQTAHCERQQARGRRFEKGKLLDGEAYNHDQGL